MSQLLVILLTSLAYELPCILSGGWANVGKSGGARLWSHVRRPIHGAPYCNLHVSFARNSYADAPKRSERLRNAESNWRHFQEGTDMSHCGRSGHQWSFCYGDCWAFGGAPSITNAAFVPPITNAVFVPPITNAAFVPPITNAAFVPPITNAAFVPPITNAVLQKWHFQAVFGVCTVDAHY